MKYETGGHRITLGPQRVLSSSAAIRSRPPSPEPRRAEPLEPANSGHCLFRLSEF